MERLRQVELLFHSASDRPPEDRAAFLEQACGNDLALRNEVEGLLAAYEKSGGILSDVLNTSSDNVLHRIEDQPVLMPGDRIGGYEILYLLGRGGWGEVYLAHDPRLARKIAVKVLRRAFTADKERVRRLHREGRAASALNHPNILTIYEIDEDQGRTFLATEFVEGATLRKLLGNGCVPAEQAADIARQVALALEASHKADILHRDIKPENLLLRPDGYLKVLDFGLAKMLDRPARVSTNSTTTLTVDTVETEPATIEGSLFYMSPEQISGHKLDARTDIWSLGVVLYEMLTGKLPFSGSTVFDVAVAIRENDIPTLPASVPARLSAVISKALAKNPEERYATAREFRIDLEAVDFADRTKTLAAAPPAARRRGRLYRRVAVRGPEWQPRKRVLRRWADGRTHRHSGCTSGTSRRRTDLRISVQKARGGHPQDRQETRSPICSGGQCQKRGTKNTSHGPAH